MKPETQLYRTEEIIPYRRDIPYRRNIAYRRNRGCSIIDASQWRVSKISASVVRWTRQCFIHRLARWRLKMASANQNPAFDRKTVPNDLKWDQLSSIALIRWTHVYLKRSRVKRPNLSVQRKNSSVKRQMWLARHSLRISLKFLDGRHLWTQR